MSGMSRLGRLAGMAALGLPLLAGATEGQSVEGGSRVKIGATTLAGIPSVGFERDRARAGRTFQWDVMLSPWRSIDHAPFTFIIGTAEWRYYRRAQAEGWYSALHVGGTVFRMQRPAYRDSTLFQEGAGFMLGGSVGHVWRTPKGWTVDAFLGGGTVQSLYKGYDRATGRRYDGARLWNISGEILPYRTGIAVGLPPRRR